MSFFIDGQSVTEAQFKNAAVPFTLATDASVAAGDVLGFTAESRLIESLSPSGAAEYRLLLQLESRARGSTADPEFVDVVQQVEVADALQRCFRAVGRHGKTVADIPALLTTYDPLWGPPGNTLWLYGQRNYQGRVVCLSGGWGFRDFHKFDFANRASSLAASGSFKLYDQVD